MELSVFSFLMAFIWSSVFIVLLYIGRKGRFFIMAFGVSSIAALYGFSVFRMLIPLEFPFTKVIRSHTFYPTFERHLTITMGAGLTNFPIWTIFCGVWLAIALILTFMTVVYYKMDMKKLISTIPVTNERIKTMFKRVQDRNGKALKVAIVQNAAFDRVMSMGILKRYILLPDRMFDDEELYSILSHEYMHLKNRDHMVKLLCVIYRNVLWWNPLSYLLLMDLEQSLELKCDQCVTRNWSDKEKFAYMKAITKEMQYAKKAQSKKKRRENAVSISLAGKRRGKQLKERFRMIISPPMQRNKVLTAAFALVLALVFFFSYSFIIQSAYEAPIEEIVTEIGTYEINEEDIIIRKNKNGEYELITPYASQVIPEELAEDYMKNGYDFILEE